MNMQTLLEEKLDNFKTRFAVLETLMNEEQKTVWQGTTVDMLRELLSHPLAPILRVTLQNAMEGNEFDRAEVVIPVATIACINETRLRETYNGLPDVGMSSKQMLWAYVEFFLKYL